MASVGSISMQGTHFDRYIGIDYSGNGLPTDGRPGIQVFTATPDADARPVRPPVEDHWSRAALAAWLIAQIDQNQRLIVGIDHSFAPPREKMGDGLNWAEFLKTFRDEWRTDERQNVLGDRESMPNLLRRNHVSPLKRRPGPALEPTSR